MKRLAGRSAMANDWTLGELKAHRDTFQASLRPPVTRFAPHQAIDVVRRVLPRNGVLTFDVGAHTHQIASQWTAHAPRTFMITNGWSSMGFGLPAALAAKIARPDLPVVCVMGDGCFQMTCGELTVARRLGLVLPVGPQSKESKSHGAIENAVKLFMALLRDYLLALERTIGGRAPT